MPQIRLDLPPERALEFFGRKGLNTSFAWQDLLRTEHDAAFTVAKMMDVDLLREMREAVDDAIADGMTLAEFRERIRPTLVERGWWGRATMEDPLTGEMTDVQLGSTRRLRTIFNTNLRTSYAAGHWSAIEDTMDEAPYLLYDAVDDEATRDQHRQWDGTVLRADDPWWDTRFPPNGWGCRCSVIQLDDEQLQAMGKSGPDRPPRQRDREWTNPRTGEVEVVPEGVDPGWNYHPGRARADEVRDLLAQKIRQAGPGAQAAADVVDRERRRSDD
ncbi:MAG: phage minor head protein [Polyangiales bacterium]